MPVLHVCQSPVSSFVPPLTSHFLSSSSSTSVTFNSCAPLNFAKSRPATSSRTCAKPPICHISPQSRQSSSTSLQAPGESAMLVDSFLLRSSPRWITVEPYKPAVVHPHILFLDRNTLSSTLRTREECAALAEPDTETVVHGLVGLVETLHDSYLLVIRKRRTVGTILERPIHCITQLEAIPIRGRKMLKKLSTNLGLSPNQLKEEATLHAMLTSAMSLPGFYYSHAVDLTRSTQKRGDGAAAAGDVSVPDFARADMRFVWNRFAAQKLVDLGAVSWITPIILGYIDIRHGLVNGKAIQLALVSRRAADRPALRYTARGADVYGNCANFVETEQIVSHGDAFASYVQIRGSIPLLWKQEACLMYKPKPSLKDVDGGGKTGLCQVAFEKHFDSLFEHYGGVTAVSLIDNKGLEAMLYGAYEEAVKMMGNAKLHFVPWEFHVQTKGKKYDKIESDLLASIDTDLEAYGYFYTKDGTVGAITRRQHGVIRTNCIDSLDRTNVVQSVIAHRMMDASLKAMGVLDSNPETNSASKFEAFEKDFKNTWADHANALASFYAGSGAMKTDYTRTGKRSNIGLVVDGVRALRRYVYQNFFDGQRQDGIDVMLGVVKMPATVVERGAGDGGMEESRSHRLLQPIKSKAEPLLVWEKFLPHLAFLSLGEAILIWIVPGKFTLKVAFALIGLVFFAIFSRLILRVGHKLVSRPKLDGTH